MTPEKAFEEARIILTESGHKIFTPSGRYFKIKPSIIAIRPSEPRSAFLLRIHKNKLVISEMHLDCHDKAVLKEMKEKFGLTLKPLPRLFSRFRKDRWESLNLAITPKEREEFRILIEDTRLS